MNLKPKILMLLIGILLAIGHWTSAQSLALSSVVSAGGSAQNSQTSFSFSLGQVFASDGEGADRLISSGIHQVVIDYFLAVDVPFKKELLRLFPNPTEKLLFISSQADYFNDLTFELIDALGKKVNVVVQESDFQQKSLDVSDLKTGVYVLRVQLNNTYSETFRIVKN